MLFLGFCFLGRALGCLSVFRPALLLRCSQAYCKLLKHGFSKDLLDLALFAVFLKGKLCS